LEELEEGASYVISFLEGVDYYCYFEGVADYFYGEYLSINDELFLCILC